MILRGAVVLEGLGVEGAPTNTLPAHINSLTMPATHNLAHFPRTRGPLTLLRTAQQLPQTIIVAITETANGFLQGDAFLAAVEAAHLIRAAIKITRTIHKIPAPGPLLPRALEPSEGAEGA